MLLSLYLEACIAQYHNIGSYCKNLYDITLSFPKATIMFELKTKIKSWLDYRVVLINKLNSSNKTVKMYKNDLSITYNINEFEYIDLSYYYDEIEIEKLKCLCRHRTESFGKTMDQSLEDIDKFFSGNKMLKIVDFFTSSIPPSNRDSIEYTLFQAIHTYEQIINELVNTRYEYLVKLRSLFSKNEYVDHIEKILPTC